MTLVAGVDGWLSAREGAALFACASRCRGTGVIVEIGSWQGRSTIVLAAASRAAARAAVHAIDPHGGIPGHGPAATLSRFRANLARAGVADLVRIHVQTSAAAARDFAAPIELVYIDGAHDYASVLADFSLWFPKVVDGGVMAFHDTVGYPGPRRVVRDHLYRSRRFRRVRFAGSLTYAEKTARATTIERWGNELRWWINQGYAATQAVRRRLGAWRPRRPA